MGKDTGAALPPGIVRGGGYGVLGKRPVRSLPGSFPPALGTQEAQQKAKKPKRSHPISLPELEEEMDATLNGGGKTPGNFRTALNTFVQIICRRPITKADVTTGLDKGPPVAVSLSIPCLDVLKTCELDGQGTLEARKQAEQNLAEETIAELLERLRSGEITLNEEPLPRPAGEFAGPAPTPNQQGEGPKSQLNCALQKLLGRTLQKSDRVFKIDMEGGRAILRLPTLSPPLRVECELPHSADESMVRGDVEHELAQMALDELVGGGLLFYDPDAPAVQAYQSAKGPAAAKEVSTAYAAVQQLRQFTDAWECSAGDEYQEHYTLASGSEGEMQWDATLMLHIDEGEGNLMEGQGRGTTQEEAKEAAAAELLMQIELAGLLTPTSQRAPAPAAPKQPPVDMVKRHLLGGQLGGPRPPTVRPRASVLPAPLPGRGKGKGKLY